MAGILVVCTGNVCRSPIAEAVLRAALEVRFGAEAPSVRSAGTMGWVGSPAEPEAVKAAAERGIDISTHAARAIDPEEVLAAELVLGMSAEHVRRIVSLASEARPRTFALKELVPLLERLPTADPPPPLAERVAAASELRERTPAPRDLDVADPLGMPLESFRAVAWELETWCARLVDGLFGPATDRAAAEVRER